MLENLVVSYYSFLEKIGLGSYSARFVMGAGVLFLTQMVVSPSVSYNEDGTAKPFVLFSGQNSIKQLQEWGFTTFESLIDERYDQQPNPALRTKHIIKSLNELYHSSNRLETIGKMYELANKNIEHYNKFINV